MKVILGILSAVVFVSALGCGKKSNSEYPQGGQGYPYPPHTGAQAVNNEAWPRTAPQMVVVRRNGRMMEYAITNTMSENELRENIRAGQLGFSPQNDLGISGAYPQNPTSGLYFIEKPEEMTRDPQWNPRGGVTRSTKALKSDSSFNSDSGYYRYSCQYQVGFWNYQYYCGGQQSYSHYYPNYWTYNNWWNLPTYYYNYGYYYYRPTHYFSWSYYQYYVYSY